MSWPDARRLRYTPTLRVPSDDGTGIAVEILGDGHPGPTFVFAHGWTFSSRSYHYQRMLAEKYRLVFMDHRGHGESDLGPRENRTVDQIGRDLAAVIEATCANREVILVGHSMGGMTIMSFAEKYPEWFGNRVTGVVLISTSARLIDRAKLALPSLVARASAPFFPLWGTAAHLGGNVIERARFASSDLAWLLTRRYGFGDSKPSPSLVSFVEGMNSKTSVETLTKYLNTLYNHNRYPALAALRGVPVLVVVGDKDYLTPVSHSEEIIKRLPDARMVKIEDSGHVVMLEKAADVNAAILPFVEKIS